MLGPCCSDIVRGNSASGNDDDARSFHSLRKRDSMHGDMLFIALNLQSFLVPKARKTLGSIGDLRQLLNAAAGILPYAGLS